MDTIRYDFEDIKLKGFNVDEGLNFTGSVEKYAAALQRFLRRAENTETSIKHSTAAGDYEELTILVHALKGNARTIGADALANVAEAMELDGKKKAYDDMVSRMDELFRAFDETVSALKPYGEMEELHPRSEISAAEAEKAGTDLIDAVEDYDDERAKELIDKLMRYPFRYTLINVLKNARDDIMEYEYTEALVKIKRVVSQIED
ncbi:MAG: Hpt domain-containing protein [Lachnospiraceae bacterium]|nr:Hpt domain-containing protein [Lachnospiraceae bacterium]